MPVVGNVYYARIGVSMHMNNKFKSDRTERLLYFQNIAEREGIILDNNDKAYIRYKVAKEKGLFFEKWKYWFLSIEPSLLITRLKINRYLFALLRRIPHKSPIVDYKL